MNNDTRKTKVFKLMIGALIGLVIVGYGWTRSSMPTADDTTINSDSLCVPQADSCTAFEQAVFEVIKGFNQRDAKVLNQLISDDLGLIVLFRRGVYDTYGRVDKLDFENPVPEYWPYPDYSYKPATIYYDSLPKYSCDTEKWDKTGLYCDTTEVDHLLSRTAENLVKYEGDVANISEEAIRSYKELENSSRRVVLATQDDELIFYLTLANGKWYLTILDRVSFDCSA